MGTVRGRDCIMDFVFLKGRNGFIVIAFVLVGEEGVFLSSDAFWSVVLSVRVRLRGFLIYWKSNFMGFRVGGTYVYYV